MIQSTVVLFVTMTTTILASSDIDRTNIYRVDATFMLMRPHIPLLFPFSFSAWLENLDENIKGLMLSHNRLQNSIDPGAIGSALGKSALDELWEIITGLLIIRKRIYEEQLNFQATFFIDEVEWVVTLQDYTTSIGEKCATLNMLTRVLSLRENADVTSLSNHTVSLLQLQSMFIDRLLTTFDPNLFEFTPFIPEEDDQVLICRQYVESRLTYKTLLQIYTDITALIMTAFEEVLDTNPERTGLPYDELSELVSSVVQYGESFPFLTIPCQYMAEWSLFNPVLINWLADTNNFRTDIIKRTADFEESVSTLGEYDVLETRVEEITGRVVLGDQSPPGDNVFRVNVDRIDANIIRMKEMLVDNLTSD